MAAFHPLRAFRSRCTVSPVHWVLGLIALVTATWAVTAVAKGRVKVFNNPDTDFAIYRDVQPVAFWSFTGLYALLTLAALILAIR